MRTVQATSKDWKLGRQINTRRWFITWTGEGPCPALDGVPFTRYGSAKITMRQAVALTLRLDLTIVDTTDGKMFRNAVTAQRAALTAAQAHPDRVYAWMFEGDVHTGSLTRWAEDDEHARPRSLFVSQPVEIIAGDGEPQLRKVTAVVEHGEWITDTGDTAPHRLDVHA